MRCPVCEKEHSTLLCPNCGYDASRDYERHPTFGSIKTLPSVASQRRQWQETQKKPASDSKAPLFVDYSKMVSLAAKEDESKRKSQEYKLLQEFQAAKDQIATLKREQRILTDSLIPENQQLKERILAVHSENKELKAKFSLCQNDLETANAQLQQLQETVKRLETQNANLKNSKEQLGRNNTKLNNQYQNAIADYNQLMKEKKKLLSQIQKLEAALEAERNKGLISRIFNR